jgi:ABC-type glycerol-3-phosphate transport system substrate-binding protein
MRLAMVLLAMTLAACGAAPATQPPTNLGVDNGTTVTVTSS